MSVAPWQVHICALNIQKDEVRQAAGQVYKQLCDKHLSVLFDDRKAAAGIQFADADLLGVPVRVVISQRGLANGEIEISTRDNSVKMSVAKDSAVDEVIKLVESLSE